LDEGDSDPCPQWRTDYCPGSLDHRSRECSSFAVRKKRIPKQEAIEFLDDLNVLSIEVDPTPDPAGAANILSVAEKHRLTAYDATYLELAIRRKLALATLDADLKMAARAESLVLL